MNKQIMISATLLCFAFPCGAQTWGEWFNQKSTQKKYLLEQIAALKVYTDFLKKGYTVAKDGSRLIGDIKNGDFNLHTNYFGSLKAVNPAIKKQDKIAYMMALQSEMSLLRQRLLTRLNLAGQISSQEKGFVRKRLDDLSAEAGKDIDELTLLVTDGMLELTDDERIARIDKLYQTMTAKYVYQKQLSNNVLAMLWSADRQQKDNDMLKALYGLEN